MAERVGFEPTVGCPITSFQDWLLKPLGHLSMGEIISSQRKNVKEFPMGIIPKGREITLDKPAPLC